jgi:hypothetical protein
MTNGRGTSTDRIRLRHNALQGRYYQGETNLCAPSGPGLRIWRLACLHGIASHARLSSRDVTPARIEWEDDKTAQADLSIQLSISSLWRRPCFIPFFSERKAGGNGQDNSQGVLACFACTRTLAPAVSGGCGHMKLV